MAVSILDGSSVHYRAHGSGEAALLIHGLGGSGADLA
jgi:pimeloyl-ACP methyl ester carboxylesterase